MDSYGNLPSKRLSIGAAAFLRLGGTCTATLNLAKSKALKLRIEAFRQKIRKW